VAHRLAKAMLIDGDLSRIRERWPEIAQCFPSQKAYDTARGTLEKGDGIGVPLIRSYLGNGDEELSPRDKHTVGDGLAVLKDLHGVRSHFGNTEYNRDVGASTQTSRQTAVNVAAAMIPPTAPKTEALPTTDLRPRSARRRNDVILRGEPENGAERWAC
jgi:hypothetical protein